MSPDNNSIAEETFPVAKPQIGASVWGRNKYFFLADDCGKIVERRRCD